MKRRDLLRLGGVVMLGGLAVPAIFPTGFTRAADGRKRKVLYFTRCNGFVHGPVTRHHGELAFSEKLLIEEGKKQDVEVVCTKDGSVFDGDLDQWDTIAFYTSGNLCDKAGDTDEPCISQTGKAALLNWVENGGGFVGFHSATDTFRTDKIDPYIAMIGAEFIVHGSQQDAWQRATSECFPGTEGIRDFHFLEEWYTHYKFAKDMQVLLIQDTTDMKRDGGDQCYDRASFPATWARRHGKGRVFYTSMGHREDVWEKDIFRQIVLGGFAWTMKNVDFDVVPNFEKVTPDAEVWNG
ncbi:MAG: ThuA domain-containing protein [Thermoguttaceae bacterium]|nr:ThuA domain-containing protein [Thermoguttaceae bacterium]